jgi:ribosomal protein S18 acetylase RimI-like enzyme
VTVRLRVLRDDELPAYRASAERGYIDDISERGGVPRPLAEEKARRDFEQLWPDGRPAAGQAIYAVEDAETHERVGFLWLAERDSQGRQVLWIYDIHVDEELRGRGHGRAAMGLVEEQARERGLARVELNVFGGNEVARTLYRSLGYEESAIWMGKDLQ